MLRLHKIKAIPLFLMLALVFTTAYVGSASAASLSSLSDTMTDHTVSEESDHTISFTLPSGSDFDNAGGQDVIKVDFPTTTAFADGGTTWATSQFTFNDGTARTVTEVVASTTATPADFTATCVDGANNVGIAVDTDDLIFQVAPCSGTLFTASSAAATVSLVINSDETQTNGYLTNPSVADDYLISVLHTDEGVTDANSGSLAVPIITSGDVTVTATVDPTLTFTLSANTCTLGALEAISVSTCTYNITTSTNATGGLKVAASAPSAVLLAGNGTDDINACDSGCTAGGAGVTAGTEEYGFYVSTAGHTATGYTTDSQPIPTSSTDILTMSGPHTSTLSTITHGASITATTPAGSYSQTITWTATGTF